MKKTTTIGILITALTIFVAMPTQAASGKTIYLHHCAMCHGPTAEGNTFIGKRLNIPNYSLAKNWKNITQAQAVKDVTDGIRKNGRLMMRPFKNKLSKAEIQAAVKTMKGFAKK